jgi:hypothetical protein
MRVARRHQQARAFRIDYFGEAAKVCGNHRQTACLRFYQADTECLAGKTGRQQQIYRTIEPGQCFTRQRPQKMHPPPDIQFPG